MLLNVIFVLQCVLIYSGRAQIPRFRVIKEWRYINFTWPNEESLLTATAKGLYIPENNLMAGINYYEDYYYLALPRMRDGVPVTLGRIKTHGSTAPLIEPFPSWEMNNLGDCNAIQNAQNLEIDSKGQAWIIDTGRTSTLSAAPSTNCPPKLLIFDIKSNRTTTVYTFPESVASRNSSYLYDIVVDNTDAGYAYITDNSGKDPGIIVYSVKENRSWKLRHSKSMRADRSVADFRVNDAVVSSPINIAGIALGPKANVGTSNITLSEDRDVYYTPISSLHLYSISTSVLRNENSSNNGGEYEGFVRDVGIKPSETDGMMMDNKGVLYYGLLSTSSIARWDSSKSFVSSQTVLATDATYVQWPNSFAFSNGNVVVLTNKLQKFIFGKMDLAEANFRVLEANTGSISYVYDDDTLIYSSHIVNNSETTGHDKPEAEPVPEPEPNPAPKNESGKANAVPEPNPKPEPVPQAEPTSKEQKTESASKIAPDTKEPTAKPEPSSSVVIKAAASSASNFVTSIATIMMTAFLIGSS